MSKKSLACLILWTVLIAAPATAVRADEPLDIIPADSLLCWYGRPLETPAAPDGEDGAAALATWVNLGSRLVGHPLGGEVLIWIRVIEALGQMSRYPHAVAVIDAAARPVGPGGAGRRIDRLRLAVVIKTDGRSEPFRRTIQKVINEQTNAGTAKLRREKIGDWIFQTLHDERLPGWAAISWGEMGRHFVITVGDGVWADVADVARGRKPSINADAWSARARARLDAPAAVEVFADFDGIRRRLDPLVDNRASEFFSAWRTNDVGRSHWAVGFKGSGLYCSARFRRGNRDVERTFADPSFGAAWAADAILSGVRHAVFRVAPREVIPRLIGSLLATRDIKTRDNVERQWERIQESREFDAQTELLDNLGEHILLHAYPPHPLRIPVALTVLIEIRRSPEQVRDVVEKMCTGWKSALDAAASESGAPNLLSLYYDDDIWHLQIGFIAGPAWTVTDRFIVASWSPSALRAYLLEIGAARPK